MDNLDIDSIIARLTEGMKPFFSQKNFLSQFFLSNLKENFITFLIGE